MRRRKMFARVLSVVLTAAMLPWPQAPVMAEGNVEERNAKAAQQQDALPQPAYFWDFENVQDSNLANQGTAGGTAVLHGAATQKAAVAIEDDTYSGEGNFVLSLAGGNKGTSWVELPANLYEGVSAETGLTWSFWMKPDAAVGSYTRLFSSADSSNGNEFAYAPFAADKVWNLIFDGGSVYRQIYGSEPAKGVWSYITVTVSKDEVVFYVNGDKSVSRVTKGETSLLRERLNGLAAFTNHALGKTTSTWNDADCKVQLDEVAVYKTALTAGQVAGLAQSYGLTPEGPREMQDAQEGSYGLEGKQLEQVPALTVSSPQGTNQVKIWKDSDNRYYYSVSRNGKTVIECSALGLNTKTVELVSDMALDAASVKEESGVEEYDLLQGSSSKVRKQYRERAFTLTKENSKVTLYFRVFEDGMAYRYEVDGNTAVSTETTTLTGEASEFMLPDKGKLWTVPVSVTYEGINYSKRTVEEQYETEEKYSTPVLASLGEDSGNAWVLLTEANVYNEENPYCGSVFQTEKGNKAIKVIYSQYLKEETDESKDAQRYTPHYDYIQEVPMQDVFHTPWRTAVIASDLEGIANSSLVTDLNPASSGDFSWVEPGASVWSWWSSSYDAIEYKTMQDYIDFAAEVGMKYCLVDYGWELWENYQDKIADLVQYADGKGVSILVWYGVNKFDADHIFDLDSREEIEEQFAWCEQVGVKGVKVDYINSASPFAMKVMYYLADIAAEHHLVINYHGCINPGGENRTYPNIISSEAVAGMENFKWNNAPNAASMLTLPYTRNVLGSMEFTPTAYRDKNSNVTSGFMLAQAVVYESALQSFAHSAYVYPGYHGLSLISDVPTTWDESRLLAGYPGESVIRARRKGDNWYVGAMTLEEKVYSIPLTFLEKGRTYHAYIYKDNEDGDNIEIETRDVTSETVLSMPLLANGGCSIKFSATDPMKWTSYDNYNYYEAEEYGRLGGTAKVEDNQYASNWRVVGYIGNGGTLEFQNIKAKSAGTYGLTIYYVSGKARDMYLRVNDGEEIALEQLLGYANDWKAVAAVTVPVQLQEGDNTLLFYNENGDAPSIDRIAVPRPKRDISGAEIQLSQDSYVYDGKACTPDVAVTCGGEKLKENIDFTVSYENSQSVGTARVVITGIGDWSGTAEKTFVITAAQESGNPQKTAVSIMGTNTYTKTYGAKPFSLKISSGAGKEGTLTYQSDNTNVAGVDSAGKVTVKASGIATITVKLVSSKYTAADYKITVKVKPSKVALSSVKSRKKKQISVAWKKISTKQKISGYQIAYSANRKFKPYQKMEVNKSKKSAVLKKKLKSKKNYYVRVRAYKKAGKAKLYGAWSKTKKIKVK